MKESYGEGLANHIGPESCGGDSNGAAEALTGERAGRVWSREDPRVQGADAVLRVEGNTERIDSARFVRPCAVRDPEHVRKHFTREPGDPISATGREEPGGCIVKSEDARR
jgi:hypothetical protein